MRALLALLGVLQADQGTPAEFRGTERSLRVTPPRIDVAVTIDGILDESVWSRAPRLTDFSQFSPSDGRPAEDSTEVLVWYSPTAIYFGIRAQAAPGTVRAHLADRDKG